MERLESSIVIACACNYLPFGEKAALWCGGGSAFLEILEQVFGNLLVPIPTHELAVFYHTENSRGGLDAGAKLLIKIGLYRILNQVSAAAL